jgi:hypothetical protein
VPDLYIYRSSGISFWLEDKTGFEITTDYILIHLAEQRRLVMKTHNTTFWGHKNRKDDESKKFG